MKVSIKSLQTLNACQDQIDLFESIFGDEVEISMETLTLAQEKELNIDWWAKKVFGDAYVKVKQSHEDAYKKAERSHLDAYQKSKQPHLDAYVKVIQPHLDAYWKAIKPHLDAYTKARQSSWDAYKKAIYEWIVSQCI